MVTTAGGGLGQSQEPEASSGSSVWVEAPKHLDHLSLISQAISRALSQEWVLNHPKWNAIVTAAA